MLIKPSLDFSTSVRTPHWQEKINHQTKVFHELYEHRNHLIDWCGLPQLDLLMQFAYKKVFDKSFLNFLTRLILYLRRQKKWILRTQFKFQRFWAFRWHSMRKSLAWLVFHRDEVQMYLQENDDKWAPSRDW